MRTIEEIKGSASARINPRTKIAGYLTRGDILDALEVWGDGPNEANNLGTFMDSLGFIDSNEKAKILDDIPSYWDLLSYRMEI